MPGTLVLFSCSPNSSSYATSEGSYIARALKECVDGIPDENEDMLKLIQSVSYYRSASQITTTKTDLNYVFISKRVHIKGTIFVEKWERLLDILIPTTFRLKIGLLKCHQRKHILVGLDCQATRIKWFHNS